MKAKTWVIVIVGIVAVVGLTLIMVFGSKLSGIFRGVPPAAGESVAAKSRVQIAYEKACGLMRRHDYKHAKDSCLELLKRHPEDEVSMGKNVFLVAPAVLDMLGEIYLREKNPRAAMDCYQRMAEKYPNAYFSRYTVGEASWSGKTGPAGLMGEIRVLIALKKDYAKATEIAFRLIDKYKGEAPQLWSSHYNYEEYAKDFIRTCLAKTRASLEERELAYRSIIDKSKNNALAAELILDLAGKNLAVCEYERAAGLYREVIDKYSMVFVGSLEDEYHFYGLSAYEGLIATYEQDADGEKLNEAKYSMRNLYYRLVRELKEKNDYENAEDFISSYQQVFESVGTEEEVYEETEEEYYGD